MCRVKNMPALDRLEELQRREALRSDTAESAAKARILELTAELNEVHFRMLVPENLAMASEAKTNTVF